MPDHDVITLTEQQTSYQIFLPDRATDYIQKKIAETGTPYEVEMLRDMAAHLSSGDLVLDIGANIGNHSLYLAAHCQCRVISFEPNTHLAEALVHSAMLNQLNNLITVHANGVGASSGRAAFAAILPENSGAQNLIVDQGEIEIVALDQQQMPQPVRMIKIDVEGMELAVLQGASKLIEKDRPILYIESGTAPEMESLLTFLRRRKYLLWKTFNATPTHLFLPAETVTMTRHLEHLQDYLTRNVLESYHHSANTANLRASLNNANLKYRAISGHLHEARAAASAQALELAETKWSLRMAQAQARVQFEDAAMQAAAASRQIAALADRLHNRRDMAEARLDTDAGRIAPEVIGAWLQALPLAPEAIARSLSGLAAQLQQIYPSQALALYRVVHQIAPTDRSARCLGVALLQAGHAREALEMLGDDPRALNLSSRMARLLEQAQDGLEGAMLQNRAAQLTHSELRVAAIMDEFTATGYAPECDLQQLPVTGWLQTLEDFQPQLLLIESAWRGLHGQWGSKVGQFSEEMQGILQWCQERGIPTAFWNKEDPVHFQTFLTTAQHFDVVFTTDIDCIPRYKAGLGHDRVHLLPFACQPRIHNPLEIGPRKRAFCFAGAYYVRYPDRTRDLDNFLRQLTDYYPFEIFDRNFGKADADYFFPEDYQKYIVGTLAPTEIERAYKGYEFGINLNSVKNSQSMFARRVFELLASNTRVISNYSPGLRLMFEDLVISTDSGVEALRRIKRQNSSGISERVRLAGLRKVMSQHTYSHRIARIAELTGLDVPDLSALPPVTVLARASNRIEVEGLIAQGHRQSFPGMRMVLVAAALDLDQLQTPDWLRVMTPNEAIMTPLSELAEPEGWLAGFVPADYYGKHYLTDLVLATRYSTAAILGKASYYRRDTTGIAHIAGPSYGPVARLAARRALIRADRVPDAMLACWMRDLPDTVLDGVDILSLDHFSYCEDGSLDPQDSVAVAAAVEDPLGLSVGIDEADLNAFADALPPAPATTILTPILSGAALTADMVPPKGGKVTWTAQKDGSVALTSTLGSDEHHYVYERKGRPLAELHSQDGIYRLHPLTGPGLNILFVAVWHDDKMEKLGHQIIAANCNTVLTPPNGTAFVRFGMRPRGLGSCRFDGMIMDDHHPAPRPVVSASRVLVLTNHYPSWEDLYRNGFVHSRVRAYHEQGLTPDVYRLRPGQDLSWHEFQNITCMTGSEEQLDYLLSSGQYDHVLVHFLDATMWQVLARHIDRVRVTVWVHGAEVQPWWRRTFNYATEAELEKAKEASNLRLAFWRGLFTPLAKNLHFIFVSRYFANEVFEDLQVTCPLDQYDVIHNPIDDELFAWHEKSPELRGKILSIRPFASKVYANDLAVKAILSLQRQDFFKDLEFRIIGDGPLFDEVTAPLADLPNVTCEKRFLTQAQIAAMHRHYGVFLVPSRMDTQGVSRDEAMSSGLVPVTNQVAAIPEFVDESCGYLAIPEDAEGLAQAIIDLWRNPETFRRKSCAAAKRVREQRGKERIISAEISIIEQKSLR